MRAGGSGARAPWTRARTALTRSPAPSLSPPRSKAVDAWSLGVNLYLFLSGKLPFGADCDSEAEVRRARRHNAAVSAF